MKRAVRRKALGSPAHPSKALGQENLFTLQESDLQDQLQPSKHSEIRFPSLVDGQLFFSGINSTKARPPKFTKGAGEVRILLDEYFSQGETTIFELLRRDDASFRAYDGSERSLWTNSIVRDVIATMQRRLFDFRGESRLQEIRSGGLLSEDTIHALRNVFQA